MRMLAIDTRWSSTTFGASVPVTSAARDRNCEQSERTLSTLRRDRRDSALVWTRGSTASSSSSPRAARARSTARSTPTESAVTTSIAARSTRCVVASGLTRDIARSMNPTEPSSPTVMVSPLIDPCDRRAAWSSASSFQHESTTWSVTEPLSDDASDLVRSLDSTSTESRRAPISPTSAIDGTSTPPRSAMRIANA